MLVGLIAIAIAFEINAQFGLSPLGLVNATRAAP
jgi:hypothetical protein